MMGGRGGSAVGAVVVAPGTSSSVGRVLGNRDVEGRTRYQVQFFRLQKSNRKIAYCCIRSTYVDVRSCFRHLLLLLLFYCWCWCCCCCCCLLLLRLPLLLLLLLLVGPARCFSFFQLSCESYMVMDVVVQNSQKSSGYDQGTPMRKTCEL